MRKSDDEGISKLGRHNRAWIKNRVLHVANLEFKRQGATKKKRRRKARRGIMGRWKAELRTGKFKKEMNDWATGCKTGLKEAFGKLIEAKPKHKVHTRMVEAANDWATGFCKALVDLNSAVEPYNGSAVGSATGALLKAKNNWNKNIFTPIKQTADSVEADLKSSGF
jgi:hypothetical protein